MTATHYAVKSCECVLIEQIIIIYSYCAKNISIFGGGLVGRTSHFHLSTGEDIILQHSNDTDTSHEG